jgi:endo-1,4-beta-xylanase
VLTCGTGFDGAASVGVVWLRDGVAIPNATGQTYRVRVADFGHDLSCQSTATGAGGAATTSVSPAVRIRAGDALRTTSAPEFDGNPLVGRRLRVSHGRWHPGAGRFTYQWLINGKPIRHATHSWLLITFSDVGDRITAIVTAHHVGYRVGRFRVQGTRVG